MAHDPSRPVPLRQCAKRVTVEFCPEDAALIDATLARRRAIDPTETLSDLFRDLVRQHCSA